MSSLRTKRHEDGSLMIEYPGNAHNGRIVIASEDFEDFMQLAGEDFADQLRRNEQDRSSHADQLADMRHDRDEWRSVHRKLAERLCATERGRDHCDAMIVIAAIKRAFGITHIAVARDGSQVHITTDDGNVHHILTPEEI
jgi:hypothetical protein